MWALLLRRKLWSSRLPPVASPTDNSCKCWLSEREKEREFLRVSPCGRNSWAHKKPSTEAGPTNTTHSCSSSVNSSSHAAAGSRPPFSEQDLLLLPVHVTFYTFYLWFSDFQIFTYILQGLQYRIGSFIDWLIYTYIMVDWLYQMQLSKEQQFG